MKAIKYLIPVLFICIIGCKQQPKLSGIYKGQGQSRYSQIEFLADKRVTLTERSSGAFSTDNYEIKKSKLNGRNVIYVGENNGLSFQPIFEILSDGCLDGFATGRYCK